ncbi:unnamed protein product [Symbiodinium sp. KB8]|nr:unnamed protein product [Symbiodinium sp. KB8]
MRASKEEADPTSHLKRSCLQMGDRVVWTSITRSQLQDAPSKANDPKWSTELRAIDANLVEPRLFRV